MATHSSAYTLLPLRMPAIEAFGPCLKTAVKMLVGPRAHIRGLRLALRKVKTHRI